MSTDELIGQNEIKLEKIEVVESDEKDVLIASLRRELEDVTQEKNDLQYALAKLQEDYTKLQEECERMKMDKEWNKMTCMFI